MGYLMNMEVGLHLRYNYPDIQCPDSQYFSTNYNT